MQLPQIEAAIYARSELGGALRQGEILTELRQAKLALETVGTDQPKIIYRKHSYAIVLSQDCDLSQDWRKAQGSALPPGQETAQRQLPTVLFAQMSGAPDLKEEIKKNDHWQRIMQNKDERYHFLGAILPECDALGEGLQELGIDFKCYFTIPTDEVYKRIEQGARRRCRLLSPYLEHLSTRFCYYQFRVALPQDHQSA